ncbi:hypothetical protein EJB05_11257 [Eragrostis curvula]|uniref:Uncharacterized protein n=1 Tax=Eragrostis curvula TaxID=38414 RepID=A0A5J9VR66_9POAL|nr:hypothetical protein EJB05_11257 [Eragrostis curvula]
MGLRGTQGMWPLRWLNCKGSQLVRGINLASRWCTGPHNIIFLATSSHAEYCFLLRKNWSTSPRFRQRVTYFIYTGKTLLSGMVPVRFGPIAILFTCFEVFNTMYSGLPFKMM